MELAGLSVASAVYEYDSTSMKSNSKRKILIVSGPGNNGGDGLVAARHLYHFGYDLDIVYPKCGKGSLFSNLIKQCEDLNIPILPSFPDVEAIKAYDFVVDAIFGFSFEGTIREPFQDIISKLVQLQKQRNYTVTTAVRPVVISVDVPSGWDVNNGDVQFDAYRYMSPR